MLVIFARGRSCCSNWLIWELIVSITVRPEAIYVYAHTHIYKWICIFKCIYEEIYIHMHICTYMPINTNIYMHVYISRQWIEGAKILGAWEFLLSIFWISLLSPATGSLHSSYDIALDVIISKMLLFSHLSNGEYFALAFVVRINDVKFLGYFLAYTKCSIKFDCYYWCYHY